MSENTTNPEWVPQRHEIETLGNGLAHKVVNLRADAVQAWDQSEGVVLDHIVERELDARTAYAIESETILGTFGDLNDCKVLVAFAAEPTQVNVAFQS